jgi:hypothetical protein
VLPQRDVERGLKLQGGGRARFEDRLILTTFTLRYNPVARATAHDFLRDDVLLAGWSG